MLLSQNQMVAENFPEVSPGLGGRVDHRTWPFFRGLFSAFLLEGAGLDYLPSSTVPLKGNLSNNPLHNLPQAVNF